MRRVLGVLAIALLAGAVMYHLLSGQQGFVLVSVGRYVLELSLWTGIVLLVLVFFALVLLRWCYGLLFLPGRWWRWRRGKRAARFRNRTDQGLMDYFEGNWADAAANLGSAASRAPNPLLSYLGAAAASINAGEIGDAELLLYQLKKTGTSGDYAARLLRARLLLREQRFSEALPLAEKLVAEDPAHPAALRLLASCHQHLTNWQALAELLPELKKQGVYTDAELTSLEVALFGALLEAFEGGANDATDGSRQAELERLWSRVPRRLQDDERLFGTYITRLRDLGRAKVAEARLRRHLNRHWSDRLAALYGTLAADTATQLTVAEAWLVEHPDNPVLLTALGKICARNRLWGKARAYFEKSLATARQPDCFYQLGLLHRQLGDKDSSADCFRHALMLLLEGPSDVAPAQGASAPPGAGERLSLEAVP